VSDALKAGSVYVAISASLGEFTRQLAGVVKAVEQTAARVKAAAAPLADVGRLFAAGMAGAVYASSKSNAALAADVERLKAQLYTLVADIGDAFAPFVKQLTTAISSLVGAFQRLSPETKAAAAKVVVFMAALGAGATVVGKAATLVEGVAKVAATTLVPALGAASTAAKLLGQAGGAAFPALGEAVAGMEAGVMRSVARMAAGFVTMLIPIAAAAAAVAGLVLLAGALYEAWNGGSNELMQQITGFSKGIMELGALIQETLAGWWGTLRAFLLEGVKGVLDVVAGAVKKLANVVAPIAKVLHLDDVAGIFNELQNLTGEKLLKDLQSGANVLTAGAGKAGDSLGKGFMKAAEGLPGMFLTGGLIDTEGIKYGLQKSLKGAGRIASDTGLDKVGSNLKNKVMDFLGGPGGRTRTTAEERDRKAKEAYDRFSRNMAAAAEYANASEAKRADMADQAEEENFKKAMEALKDEASRDKDLADLQEEAAAEQRAELARGSRATEEAWQDYTKSVRADAEAAAASVREAKDALVDRFTHAFGDVSELADTFSQGMAAGGPAAAFGAVLGDLLTRSTQFQHLVEVLNGIVGMVADTVGKVAEPFIPLLGAVSMVVKAGLDALAPAFSLLGSFITPLVPPLVVVGELLQALAPIIAIFMQALVLIHQPMLLLSGPVMHALFDVLKLVSRVILTVVRAVAGVWNGIVGAVQSVLRTLGSLSILGKKPLGFLNGWADGLQSAIVNTDAMTAAMNNLAGQTWDQAANTAAQTAEVVRNREALAKANEELSNVPNAFKAGLRRFQAQDSQSSFNPSSAYRVPVATMPSSGSVAGRPPPAGMGAGPAAVGPAVQIDSVVINSSSPADSAAQLESVLDRVTRRLTGSRGRASEWAVPEGG
jgi:phage-related protein